jgi:hypothetical protein
MNKAQQRFESALKKILKTPAAEVQRRIAAAKKAKSEPSRNNLKDQPNRPVS